MKTYLVTGAAGFIGANYIKYILAKHSDIKVVVLDALTYAGNLGTIAKDIDNERCFFIKGDICSREVVDSLFAEYRFDYVVNFAAESHVQLVPRDPGLAFFGLEKLDAVAHAAQLVLRLVQRFNLFLHQFCHAPLPAEFVQHRRDEHGRRHDDHRPKGHPAQFHGYIFSGALMPSRCRALAITVRMAATISK